MSSLDFSQSDAVCEPDGPAHLGHRLDLGAALHPTGGAAGSGELGCQEVRPNRLSADELKGWAKVNKTKNKDKRCYLKVVYDFIVACNMTELCTIR